MRNIMNYLYEKLYRMCAVLAVVLIVMNTAGCGVELLDDADKTIVNEIQTQYHTDSQTGTKAADVSVQLTFRTARLLEEHYQKHGRDMGFANAEEYQSAAAAVVKNPSALHKTEAEDGDDVYYIESTNEFVVVSTDGYIRTYFKPDSGIRYYNRQ